MASEDPLVDNDDLAEGHVRLRKALAGLDVRTGEILAAHIALEVELDLTFEELFPNPKVLAKMGFGNKVRILQAVYSDVIVDMAGAPLLAFDALRNSIAHKHDRREINAKYKAVCDSLDIDKETATVQGIAHVLTTYLVVARRELIATI